MYFTGLPSRTEQVQQWGVYGYDEKSRVVKEEVEVGSSCALHTQAAAVAGFAQAPKLCMLCLDYGWAASACCTGA